MTESMIERVARIIEPQAWRALGLGDTLAYENRRTSSLRKARVAIAVMREPTDAMMDAAFGSLPTDGDEITTDHIAAVWPAMIDAALNEQVAG